jgi:hypothetical protein
MTTKAQASVRLAEQNHPIFGPNVHNSLVVLDCLQRFGCETQAIPSLNLVTQLHCIDRHSLIDLRSQELLGLLQILLSSRDGVKSGTLATYRVVVHYLERSWIFGRPHRPGSLNANCSP